MEKTEGDEGREYSLVEVQEMEESKEQIQVLQQVAEQRQDFSGDSTNQDQGLEMMKDQLEDSKLVKEQVQECIVNSVPGNEKPQFEESEKVEEERSQESTNSTGQEQGSEKTEETNLEQDLVSNHDGFQGRESETVKVIQGSESLIYPPKSEDKVEELKTDNDYQNLVSTAEVPGRLKEPENENDEFPLLETAADRVPRSPSVEMSDQFLEKEKIENQVVIVDPQGGHLAQNSNTQTGETYNINLEKGTVFSGCHTNSIQYNHQTSVVLQDVVKAVAKGLKSTYTKMSYSLFLPGSGKCIDLQQYFEKLRFSQRQCKRFTNQKIWDMRHLFKNKNHRKPTRIVLQEDDSTMSSGLLMHICRSWAKSEGSVAGIFDLVIRLDGKELANVSLEDLIIKTCRIEGVTDDEVLEIVKANRNTLLILDDLPPQDETKMELRESLQLLLNSRTYELMTVLVTSHRATILVPRKNEVKQNEMYYVDTIGTNTCVKFAFISPLDKKDTIDILSINVRTCRLMSEQMEMNECDGSMGELGRLANLLLIVDVFFGKETKTNEVGKDIFMKLFDELKTKQFGNMSTNWDSLPPGDILLSKLGEYVLNVLASDDSCLTYEGMEKHFGDDLGTVLKLGFLVVGLQYQNESYTKELVRPPKPLLEIMISYHLWIVYKTKPKEEFLAKLDVLNKFEPLNTDGCTFTCKSLVSLLGFDAEDVYLFLRRERKNYKRLLLLLNIKLRELDNNLSLECMFCTSAMLLNSNVT